ncbi:uncharacterized protein LOC118464792 [Anopheles albimanus]|uniref:uncharacterized protein LOC118464792 n=1 Tax=Anopheles albimanus TaxID=7167 RepID=UPI00163FFE87|nr:uncharacterized protein LOC118464792 [Anopheles albimanus]
MKSLTLVIVAGLSISVGLVQADKDDDTISTAIAARSNHYYDEMWYRFWTFPVTMAIKAKVVAWLLFITFFSTIVQAYVYQRSVPQFPEIYSVPAQYSIGPSSYSSWG